MDFGTLILYLQSVSDRISPGDQVAIFVISFSLPYGTLERSMVPSTLLGHRFGSMGHVISFSNGDEIYDEQ